MLKWIWVSVWVPLFYHAGAQNRAAYPKAVIACDNMNTVYRGLENPVSVAVPGYMPNEIDVTCTGCLSLQGDNGRYMLKPGAVNQIELQVYSLRKRDQSKTISSQKFRVMKIPDPVLYLFGQRDRDSLTFLPIDSSALTPYWFYPQLQNMDICVTMRVIEFTVIFPLESKWFEKTYTDNRFPQELLQKLTRLGKGTTILFPSIKVAMPDNSVRNLYFTVYKK